MCSFFGVFQPPTRMYDYIAYCILHFARKEHVALFQNPSEPLLPSLMVKACLVLAKQCKILPYFRSNSRIQGLPSWCSLFCHLQGQVALEACSLVTQILNAEAFQAHNLVWRQVNLHAPCCSQN